MAVYYVRTLGAARKDMVEVLRKRIKAEGEEKALILEMIEAQKRELRSVMS